MCVLCGLTQWGACDTCGERLSGKLVRTKVTMILTLTMGMVHFMTWNLVAMTFLKF